jgi:hypothetical protein
MKRKMITLGLLSASCLALMMILGGCGVWETTKNIYKGAILPAEVDLEEGTGLSEAEKKMARVFKGIDEHIEDLTRTLLVQENMPDEAWMQSQLTRFSWLNGVMSWDSDGDLEERIPEQSIKKADVQDLLDVNGTSIQSRRSITFMVQDSELGPEVFLVRFLYQAAELHGSLAAHFDPRTLALQSSEPDEVLLFTPEHLLWSGMDGLELQDLKEIDWEEKLEHDVAGRVEVRGETFYWMARYIGDKPLFYAVQAAE